MKRIKGSSWLNNIRLSRSAILRADLPDNTSDYLSFRLTAKKRTK